MRNFVSIKYNCEILLGKFESIGLEVSSKHDRQATEIHCAFYHD